MKNSNNYINNDIIEEEQDKLNHSRKEKEKADESKRNGQTQGIVRSG